MLLPFEKLPEKLQNEKVKPYYDILYKKRAVLFWKRVTDLFISILLLVFLLIPMLILAIIVKCTSKGPVLYKQKRVTTYGKVFNIFKFTNTSRNDVKTAVMIPKTQYIIILFTRTFDASVFVSAIFFTIM